MNDRPERDLNERSEQSQKTLLPPVIVIAGPTAVGKTDLSIALAMEFDGEVVNADSRYLYRGFSIGVAKPTIEERQGIPHHLIDILDPWEEMSLALYQQRALAAIRSVQSHRKLPFLTGGTPLYVNALVEGWRIPAVPPNPEFRERLAAEIAEKGLDHVSRRLAEFDPVAAERSSQNPRRVIRALEVFDATGQPMSELEGKESPPFRALQIGLTMPRDRLFRAIDDRVDRQIADGLVDEVKSLLAAGIDPGSPAFSSLGYRQLLPYLAGENSLDEAIERIKFDTHRYVRHQETWLRRNQDLFRLDVSKAGWMEQTSQLVRSFLDGSPSDLEAQSVPQATA